MFIKTLKNKNTLLPFIGKNVGIDSILRSLKIYNKLDAVHTTMKFMNTSCKIVMVSNLALVYKLFVVASSSSEELSWDNKGTSENYNCFLGKSSGFSGLSRPHRRNNSYKENITNPVIACHGSRGSISSNKIKEKVYKIQKLAANADENTAKVVISQLEEILSSIKGLVDTSDVKVSSLISENLKKLERMLSRSVEDSISSIGNKTQKTVKRTNAALLEKQQNLVSETAAEAEKYIQSIIALGDPKKISEVVSDKMNGLLPNIERHFSKLSLLNIPMFSDSVNEETKEMQDLINEEIRSNSEKINNAASEVEGGLLKILSKSTSGRNNSIRELMLKKTKYIFYQIQQVVSSLEDEINELAYSVSPYSQYPTRGYRRRNGAEEALDFN